MRKLLASVVCALLPLAASAQLHLISGFNFGQFLYGGEPVVDYAGGAYPTTGSIASNYGLNTSGVSPVIIQPTQTEAGVYRNANQIDGTFSAGSSRLYFDGSNGSHSFDPFGGGTAGSVTVMEVSSIDPANGQTVYPSMQMYPGDENNATLRLTGSGTTNRFSIVTNTIGFNDYTSGQAPADANFSFSSAAITGSSGSVQFFLGSTSLGTFAVNPGVYQAFAFDLPDNFYGLADATITGVVTGDLAFDHIQINGYFGLPPLAALTYWMGGDGLWTAAASPTNWRDAANEEQGKWGGGVATFGGTAGQVSVDNAGGTVEFSGAKFIVGGYTVKDGTLTTTTAATAIEVSNGASDGAANTATISSVIAGTGGLDKTGAGTLVLSGANSYTGATTVSRGTLRINGDQTTAPGAVTVKTGGVLAGTGTLGGAVTVENGGALAGGSGDTLTMGALTLAASSQINVNLGAPSATEFFKVNGNLVLDGTLNASLGANFGNGVYRIFNYTGSLTDNTLALGNVVGATSDYTLSTATANQVNLVVDSTLLFWKDSVPNWTAAGGGWKNVAGADVNYSPRFVVFNGAGGTVNVDTSGGAVSFTGAQFMSNGYTVSGGALSTAQANTGLRVDAGKTATLASALTGTGGIVKYDEGTLILTGANSHAGGTTIAQGTLQIGSGGTTGAIAGNITNNATLAFNRSDAATYAGVVSGTGVLEQKGTGTLVLTGANTHAGGTTVSQGTLQIGAGGTTGSLAGNIANNAALVFDRSDAITHAGVISGTGSVTKQGTGTLSLSGANTYTGATTVTAGTLSIGAGGTSGSLVGNITNSATVAFNRSDAVTYAGVISGSGAVTKLGGGTTTLSGANTYTGATTVSAGTLLIDGNQSTATGAITVADGGSLGGKGSTGAVVTVADGGTLVGASGTTFTMGALTLGADAAVDVTLGAPSTSRLFQVNGNLILDGTLNILAGTGLGEGLYRLFNYTGTLTDNTMVIGTAAGGASNYKINTATAKQVNIISEAAGLPVWNGTNTVWSADPGAGGWGSEDGGETGGWQPGLAIFSGNGAKITVDATAGDVVIKGIQFANDDFVIEGDELTNNTANATFRVGDGTGDSATMSATISAVIAGTGGVNKTDLGTLVLAGENTYTGGTRVTAGVLEISDDAALGAAAGGLRLDGGTLRIRDDVQSAREVVVSSASTIDTGARELGLSGGISGGGALTKRGTGRLAISGDSTHTGETTIAQGSILLEQGSLGSTSVAAGARLTGGGTIRGNLVNAGTIAPGSSPGTITIAGNLTQSATGNYAAELASATSYDKLAVEGTATLGGTLTVTAIGNFKPVPGQTFKIIEAEGGVSGTFASVVSPWSKISAMQQFGVIYNPTDVLVGFTQLPFAGLEGSDNQVSLGEAIDAALAGKTIPLLGAALNSLATEEEVGGALAQLSPLRYERWFSQALFNTSALIRATESRHANFEEAAARGGLWFQVVRRQADYDEAGESVAAKANADGIMVGAEMSASSKMLVGVVLGYTDETIELDQAGSSTEATRYAGAVYGRYQGSRFFGEALIGASYADLANRRTVDVPGVAGVAEGATESSDIYASVRTGVTLSLGKARLMPYLAAQHMSWSANELNETEVGDAALTVREQRAESLSSRVGLSVAVPFAGKSVTIMPRLDVAWRFEFEDEAREITAALGGNDFTVETSLPSQSGLIASLGLDAAFASGVSAYARLTTERNTAADEAFEARAGVDYRF